MEMNLNKAKYILVNLRDNNARPATYFYGLIDHAVLIIPRI